MFTINIEFNEGPDQDGKARKVDVRIRGSGLASEAELAMAAEFKPILQQIVNTRFLDGRGVRFFVRLVEEHGAIKLECDTPPTSVTPLEAHAGQEFKNHIDTFTPSGLKDKAVVREWGTDDKRN